MQKTQKKPVHDPNMMYAFACEAMPYCPYPGSSLEKWQFENCKWYTWEEMINRINDRLKIYTL